MTTPSITPSVGRILWYTPPAASDPRSDQSQPLAAVVARVNPDGTVNLAVFDDDGIPGGVTGVLLVQPNTEAPLGGGYAQWMPYQIATAAAVPVAPTAEAPATPPAK